MTDQWVQDFLADTVAAVQIFAADRTTHNVIEAMAEQIACCLRVGNKLLVAGNGGSAGDAQHIAGEFVSRLMFDRAPLPAIALTTDSSVLTAISNDYGYIHVFERQIMALGRPGDVFWGISTSGRSPNVIAAIQAARKNGLVTIAFCGADPGEMASADLVVTAPSKQTAIIQQIHIIAAHIVCALVEKAMFPR